MTASVPSVSAVERQLAEASGRELDALCERLAADPRAGVRAAVGRARRRAQREEAERARVAQLYEAQEELGGRGVVMGVDEVGRGPLAGPLTVCAVVLPADPRLPGLDDSKRLSAARREEVAALVRARAVAIGTCHVQPEQIDAWGMARALRTCMAGAIAAAGVEPDAVIIDGVPVHVHPREVCVVHGDARVAAVAAASIVAKVTRDAIMVSLDAAYPGYGFARNKGYGSAEHIEAIRRLGLSPVHRRSFCGHFVEGPEA